MRPIVIRGNVWKVVRVKPDDPFLIDRTGVARLATTDPDSKTIRISWAVATHMLDKVLLHEVAHAIMEETHVTDLLAEVLGPESQHLTEELLAWFLENHSIEVIDMASKSLGRQVCVNDLCVEGAGR